MLVNLAFRHHLRYFTKIRAIASIGTNDLIDRGNRRDYNRAKLGKGQLMKTILIAAVLCASAAFADVTYYVALGGDGTDPTSGDLTKAYAHPQDAIDAADGTATVYAITAEGNRYLCDAEIRGGRIRLTVEPGHGLAIRL